MDPENGNTEPPCVPQPMRTPSPLAFTVWVDVDQNTVHVNLQR